MTARSIGRSPKLATSETCFASAAREAVSGVAADQIECLRGFGAYRWRFRAEDALALRMPTMAPQAMAASAHFTLTR